MMSCWMRRVSRCFLRARGRDVGVEIRELTTFAASSSTSQEVCTDEGRTLQVRLRSRGCSR